MKEKIIKRAALLIAVALFFSCSAVSDAHPGRTDSNGGHHDYNNASGLGSYHYHHGYPAHLHENGVCPYDYDDKTGETSGTSSPARSETYVLDEPEDEPEEDESEETTAKYAPGETRRVWVISRTLHLIDCPKVTGNPVTMELGDVTKDIQPCEYCKPLQYRSMDERLGWKSVDKAHIAYAGLGIAVAAVMIIAFKKIRRKPDAEKSDSKPEQSENEQNANKAKSPVKIPPGYDVIDGLPATVGHHHRYGLYSVYVTPTGKRYHRRKKCAGEQAKLTNLYLVYQKRTPCPNCCQNYKPNMDFSWYENYMKNQK